jgi:hypothetical protein
MKSHYMFFMWNTQTSWEYYHKIRGFKYDVEEKFTSYLPFIANYLCAWMKKIF